MTHAGPQTPEEMAALIAGGTPQHDENGKVIENISTCGTCGRRWNDAMITGWTPAPSGRCPFEYWHGETKPAFTLVEFLNAANSGYPDGFLTRYYDQRTGKAIRGSGDTVAQYIVNELREGFSEGMPREQQIANAVGQLEGAIRDIQSVINALGGTCEFCGASNVPLVATLEADPDQRICATCHADPRIPSNSLIG